MGPAELGLPTIVITAHTRASTHQTSDILSSAGTVSVASSSLCGGEPHNATAARLPSKCICNLPHARGAGMAFVLCTSEPEDSVENALWRSPDRKPQLNNTMVTYPRSRLQLAHSGRWIRTDSAERSPDQIADRSHVYNSSLEVLAKSDYPWDVDSRQLKRNNTLPIIQSNIGSRRINLA